MITTSVSKECLCCGAHLSSAINDSGEAALICSYCGQVQVLRITWINRADDRSTVLVRNKPPMAKPPRPQSTPVPALSKQQAKSRQRRMNSRSGRGKR